MIFPDRSKADARVVGTVHTPRGLRLAARLRPGAVDFIELRLDALADDTALVARIIPLLKIPLILTVRDHREGGARRLNAQQRIALYAEFLPHAVLADIELASLRQLAPAVDAARAHKVGLILSHHDFKKTPTKAELSALAGRAARAGADIFKVAAHTRTAADVATLLSFLAGEKRAPLSVMGMGRFGKVSRLLFALAGSRLNYGFLDKAAVDGQWPAVLLKKRIAEL